MEVDQDQGFVDLFERLKEREKTLSEEIRKNYVKLSNNPSTSNSKELSEEIDNKHSIAISEVTRAQIVEDYDPLTFDEVRNYIEAIDMIKHEIEETEKNVLYKRICIERIETDIELYKKSLYAYETKSKEYELKDKRIEEHMTEKHLANAKNELSKMKSNLSHVIGSLYPKYKTQLTKYMAAICDNYFSSSDPYVQLDFNIKSDILETLQMAGIIAAHPTKKQMYKLAL